MKSEAKIIRNGDGKIINVLGGDVRILIASEDSNGEAGLIEQFGEPGYAIPPHVHEREDEIFHILQGQIEFTINGQKIVATPGDVVFAPRKIPHSFRVVGGETMRAHVTLVPSGMEKMLEELGQLTLPPDMNAVTAICAKHGVTIL